MIKDQRIPHMGCAHHARRPRANYDGFKSHVPLVAVFNRLARGMHFIWPEGAKFVINMTTIPKTGHVRGSKRQNP
jgi:hypothetical protein